MKKILLLILMIVVAVSAIFFTNKNQATQKNTGKLQVTASFYPMYYFASVIGGDKVDVHNITPAGAEPHDYEPSARDIAEIEKGNLLILNGSVESWGDKIQDNLKNTNVTIVVAGEGLFNKKLAEEGKQIQDPHIWLAPVLAKQEVAKITQGFIKVDPVNADYYHNNEKLLDQKLDTLDTTYKNGLSTCKLKDIITSHAAFAYLAQNYKLNQLPISGLSPDQEPSSQQLAEVANFAKEHHVHYIFFESLISPKLAETLANEIGAKTLVLDPLEGLSDDEMNQGKNYFTVMENNLQNLQIALQCNQ